MLLLLQRVARAQSATDVANELRIDVSSAQRRMENLADRGLADKDGAGFVYRANNPRDGQVRALADAYRERRVAVITLIFSKPQKQDPAKALAEAFKLKRGPSDS